MFLLNIEDKRVCDLIILILREEFPLTSKQLYYRINQFYKSVSNQAVHKTLNQLVNQTIVIKENKQYSLNIEYIEKTIKFYQETKKNYLFFKKQK